MTIQLSDKRIGQQGIWHAVNSCPLNRPTDRQTDTGNHTKTDRQTNIDTDNQ